jgi:hypothetical protein
VGYDRVVSGSEPPEPPETEVEYRRPAWIEPPSDVVPGVVPVELILARTPQRAIGLTGIRAYPTGFSCTLHLRLREDIPEEQSNFGAFNMFGDGVDPAGEFADYYLRFGVGFADGRKATNLYQRHDFDEGPAPEPPTLRLVRWRAMTGWPGRSTRGSMAYPHRGRWPSWLSGRPAASPRPGPRSTPG